MTRAQYLLVLLFVNYTFCSLRGETIDSISPKNKIIRIQHQILDSKLYQTTHIGVPLIVAGSIFYQKDHAFRNMRNSYIPRFQLRYDDYLQYSPGIIMLGLKSFGVEGRSSWGRMLTSDAFSAGLMALTVNSLKSTISKERPDRSSNNSFPSGHTATAFMFATMLHKEYGMTRSPLYSVLGYSLATGTAVSRQLNNRHWLSDVLTGAGIGIISTELGYYLAGLIFKEKGLKCPLLDWKSELESDSYSFFGLQMGYSIVEQEVHLPDYIEITGTGGVTSSLTGAWFFHPHWGVGGKFTVSQASPHVDSNRFFNSHPELEPSVDNFEARSMSYTSLLSGIHYSSRLIPGLYAGGSIMGGIGWAGTYRADIHYKNQANASPLIHCVTHPTPNLDLNAYIMHVTGKNLGVKFFVNYNTGIGKSDYTYYSPKAGERSIPITGSYRFTLHNLYIGAEIDALFWK